MTLAGPRPNQIAAQQYMNFGGRNTGDDASDAELGSLVQQLENYEGVPVISFGWVALFILLYILLIGPVDYLFLKKVLSRLELTWITFPADRDRGQRRGLLHRLRR